MKFKKLIGCALLVMAIMMIANVAHAETEALTEPSSPLPVKVLLLPKFEVGELSGDFPGEAQFYYEHYLTGAKEFEIPNGKERAKLYYKDGIILPENLLCENTVAADNLSPQKAAILLCLALTETTELEQLQEMFFEY